MRKFEIESFFSIETQHFVKSKHPLASDEAIGRTACLNESLPWKVSVEPHFSTKKASLL